jgi:hypothetical protein
MVFVPEIDTEPRKIQVPIQSSIEILSIDEGNIMYFIFLHGLII